MFLTKLYDRLPVWLFSGLVAAAILWLTLAREPLPQSTFPLIPGFDKGGHACMFGGFYFAAAFDSRLSLRKGGKSESRRGNATRAVLLAGLCVAFGGVIELLQEWTGQGRSADWIDLAADAAGVLVSMAVTPRVLRRIGLGVRIR